MAQNYTAWPVKADIDTQLASAGITVRTGTPNSYYTRKIDAVVAYLTKKTHRQFLKGSSGEVRYFDGSGTGEQVVNEFVTLEQVDIIGFSLTSTIELVNAVAALSESWPNNRIIIYQASIPPVSGALIHNFPPGRRNIKVTAQWGYGPYIPDDVWEAVAGKVAALLAAEASVDGDIGRIKKWVEGDALEEYDTDLPGKIAGWEAYFDSIIKTYRLPTNNRLSSKAVMI